MQNYVGLRFGSNSDDNQFTENIFGHNLHPVETGGSDVSGARWSVNGVGNLWDDNFAVDLDRNGINDLPHRELDLFGVLRRDFPAVAFLSDSPVLKLLRFAHEALVQAGRAVGTAVSHLDERERMIARERFMLASLASDGERTGQPRLERASSTCWHWPRYRTAIAAAIVWSKYRPQLRES